MHKPNIIFEDNHLLVVEKPAGILSQSDGFGAPDMLTWLKGFIKERDNKPGAVFLGLVHRLDRPVHGVMVFAKTSKAASRLSDQVRTHQFKKVYQAIVEGIPNKPSGTLKDYLLKDTKLNQVQVVKEGSKEWNNPSKKEAILHYDMLDSSLEKKIALLEIHLETGRPHQIRVQLSHMGVPIWGDRKYGKINRREDIALSAVRLEFFHPVSKERLSFNCPLKNSNPWNIFK